MFRSNLCIGETVFGIKNPLFMTRGTLKGNANRLNVLLGVLLFALALASRIPLVDTYYDYSFEDDSETCVVETRSFYFFFKNPSIETLPHNMEQAPTYSDGDFIVCAIAANIIGPLSKVGVIHPQLSDNRYSLIVFSMRWCGVLFSALSILICFLILVQLTGKSILSFFVTLLYYMFNTQNLHVDCIRVDHYSLCVSSLLILFSVKLFKNPQLKRNYVLIGIAAGLVAGTKLNFPFYLILTIGFLISLAWQKKITFHSFLLLLFSFLLTTAFMYFRWIIYSAEVWTRILKIYHLGEDWVVFSGTGSFFYFFWQQFFVQQTSIFLFAFLVLFYLSFLGCIIFAIKQKNRQLLILTFTFVLQLFILGFSPKFDRYGMIIPLWVSIFVAIACSLVIDKYKHNKSFFLSVLFLLLAVCVFNVKDYSKLVQKYNEMQISILETRVASLHWIRNNIQENNVVLFQSPRTSNPDMFNLNFSFSKSYLEYPFLYKKNLASFLPPTMQELKKYVNYIVLSDKELNGQFNSYGYHKMDSCIINQWKDFYRSLSVNFKVDTFSSKFKNYKLGALYIYTVNKQNIVNDSLFIKNEKYSIGNSKELQWSVIQPSLYQHLKFEIQLSLDSNMHWLFFASRDGYNAYFREQTSPQQLTSDHSSLVPNAMMRAFEKGQFSFLLDAAQVKKRTPEIENFFFRIIQYMIIHQCNFKQSANAILSSKKAKAFLDNADQIYAESGGVSNQNIAEFIVTTGLELDVTSFITPTYVESVWSYKLPAICKNGVTYYWRVRVKDKEKVMSNWSRILPIHL